MTWSAGPLGILFCVPLPVPDAGKGEMADLQKLEACRDVRRQPERGALRMKRHQETPSTDPSAPDQKGAAPSTSPVLPPHRQRVRETVSELRLLFDLSQVIDHSRDISHSLEATLSLMAQHLHMMRGMITLVSPHTGEIRIEVAHGLNPAEQRRGHYALGEGVTGRVIQSGQPMVVSNVSASPIFLNRTRSRDLQKDTIAFICVPIKFEDEVLGALSVDRVFADAVTLEEDERILTIIASMIAHAARARQNVMDERVAAIEENMRLRNALSAPLRPHGFVGNSDAMRLVYEQISQVAPSTTTVLLYGESGTGKELAAHAIHSAGKRSKGPFISLNCAALPENLIESELFGHEKGAFTGASGIRKGRFELADGGTLFLDEVGELSLLTQAKLLRVLQERCFERLGGTESLSVDVRIITATNRDLARMVEEGTFRRDLYYRLNVFPIHMPPLRERQNDIQPLAAYFVDKYAAANGRSGIRISLAVMDMLQRYSWPGNIRELENVMERAVLLVGQDGLILPQHLPRELHSTHCPFGPEAHKGPVEPYTASGTLQDRLDELERACITDALARHKGHMGHAAQALGLTERVMALRMKKHGISYKDFRQH